MLTRKSIYPFLFILFYLITNSIEVRSIISIAYFLKILFFCTFALSLLAAICYVFFRSWIKSFLFSFVTLFVYLQYGSIHDALIKIKFLNRVIHHSTLLIVLAIFLCIVFFVIKKSKINERLIIALNALYSFLTVFIVAKFIYITITEKNTPPPQPDWVATKCDTCQKPDIFLVVYDEYASSLSLKRRFNFDNTVLDSFLRAEKFNIQVNSRSNYQNTDCSMLSFLNLDYLPIFFTKNYYTRKEEIQTVANFKSTNLITFLQNNHYNIYNFSFFPILKNGREGEDSPIFSSHVLLANSLYFKLTHDLGAIIVRYGMHKNILKAAFEHQKNQLEKLREKFLTTIQNPKKNNLPSFYYLHQLSPHEPFLYDKDGNKMDVIFPANFQDKTHGYLEYVQYCNKQIINVLKTIKKVSNNNAVIIFIGDHGWRSGVKGNNLEYFANQNAIYFPDQDYSSLYDSVSNVNLLRIVLNKYFNLQLPLLKDSSILIDNNYFINKQ